MFSQPSHDLVQALSNLPKARLYPGRARNELVQHAHSNVVEWRRPLNKKSVTDGDGYLLRKTGNRTKFQLLCFFAHALQVWGRHVPRLTNHPVVLFKEWEANGRGFSQGLRCYE